MRSAGPKLLAGLTEVFVIGIVTIWIIECFSPPDSLSHTLKEEILKRKDRILKNNYPYFELTFQDGAISWTDWDG